MEKIIIEAAKAPQGCAWGEFISAEGYERSQFDNKYKKRIVLWSKDGVDYTAKVSRDENNNLVITLTEYND